ncbi:hypothetical protein PIGBHMHK_00631 [Mycoplasmopsis arginini]|nr:hypothetical protein [Mycoplasmopsis arginini]
MLVLLNVLRVAWKPLIILFILASTYFAFNRLQSQRDAAIATLNDYKQQQLVESEKQKAENETKLLFAREQLSKARVESQKQIDDLNLDKERVTNDLRRYYEVKLAKRVMDDSAGIVLPQSGDTDTATETPCNTEGTPSSTSITDRATIKLLEEACAMTTIYFNLCRSALDADSLILKRESE